MTDFVMKKVEEPKKAWNQGWLEMNKLQRKLLVFASFFLLAGLYLVFLRDDLHEQVLGSVSITTGYYWLEQSSKKADK